MLKTTVYLEELVDARLAAEARAEGVSKAELIRRAVDKLLADHSRVPEVPSVPVFSSGRPMTVAEMDDAVHISIRERAARR